MNSAPMPAMPMTSTSSGGLDDLLSNNLNGHSSNNSIPSLCGYNKNDISITFHFDRPDLNSINMNLNIVNSSPSLVSDFSLQAAVPKSMQLEILAASSTEIGANGGSISQVLKVNNPNKAAVKMRLKVSFVRDGQQVQDQGEVSNFPAVLNQWKLNPEFLNYLNKEKWTFLQPVMIMRTKKTRWEYKSQLCA